MLNGAVTVSVRSVLDLAKDDVLLEIARDNEHLRFEVDAEGDLVIMTPAGTRSGQCEGELIVQLGTWAKRDRTGVFFGPNAGFRIGPHAVRAPDASWIRRARLTPATAAVLEDDGFLRVCPDFVIELRSPRDRLRDLEAKMREYVDHGAQLGWLIDPISARRPGVQIYRPSQDVEKLERPATLSGEPVLPGFVLDLAPIWAPGF